MDAEEVFLEELAIGRRRSGNASGESLCTAFRAG
jgi:hypothetical protein